MGGHWSIWRKLKAQGEHADWSQGPVRLAGSTAKPACCEATLCYPLIPTHSYTFTNPFILVRSRVGLGNTGHKAGKFTLNGTPVHATIANLYALGTSDETLWTQEEHVKFHEDSNLSSGSSHGPWVWEAECYHCATLEMV